MLLDTLNALNHAGIDALQATCGLSVVGRDVSLVREGRRSFNSLVTLRFKGCPLQLVHLGCDADLAAKLGKMYPEPDSGSGLNALAGSFLSHLLAQFDCRNPRGTLETSEASPVTLHTRGMRTFEVQLDTGQGELFFLAEVPSRAETALAEGSEFMNSMETIYLPADWHGCKEIIDPTALDNFLTYLYKTEGDVYLEAPAGDGTSTLNSGLLVEIRRDEDRPVLKFITDFADPAQGVPPCGAEVKASVGVGDRSLEFVLTYQSPATHELDSGASVPCALFLLPSVVSVGQRRRTFRVPISESVKVEIESALGLEGASPWSDGDSIPEVFTGRLADISFSGARIIADHSQLCTGFQKGGRVVCRMFFPDQDEPLQITGVIRRSTAGPADRSHWQDELGIEFLVSPGCDRSGLDFIRQLVLEVQRTKLSQRLQVSGH